MLHLKNCVSPDAVSTVPFVAETVTCGPKAVIPSGVSVNPQAKTLLTEYYVIKFVSPRFPHELEPQDFISFVLKSCEGNRLLSLFNWSELGFNISKCVTVCSFGSAEVKRLNEEKTSTSVKSSERKYFVLFMSYIQCFY